jgi:hypothetical protein
MRRAVDFFATLLEMSAPSIEAAGSLDRAVRYGLVDGSPDLLEALRALVPVSRGGSGLKLALGSELHL